MKTCIQKF